MRFKVIVTFFLTVLFFQSNGQERNSDDLSIDPHQLRINFITPGLSYEVALADKFAFNADATLGFSFFFVSENGNRNSAVFMAPSFGLGFKGFVNRGRRVDKGKSVDGNSGVYLGPLFQFSGPELFNSNSEQFKLLNTIMFGAIFGIQRQYPRGVNIDFAMGPGYRAVKQQAGFLGPSDGFTFLGKFLVSYNLFAKKY